MEKFYLSKAVLAGGGEDASPGSTPDWIRS